MAEKGSQKLKEIRFMVPESMHEVLTNIKRNLSTNFTQMYRPITREYIDKQPEHLKRNPDI